VIDSTLRRQRAVRYRVFARGPATTGKDPVKLQARNFRTWFFGQNLTTRGARAVQLTRLLRALAAWPGWSIHASESPRLYLVPRVLRLGGSAGGLGEKVHADRAPQDAYLRVIVPGVTIHRMVRPSSRIIRPSMTTHVTRSRW